MLNVLLQNMTVLSANPDYASCDQSTTHQWVASVFADGGTCLLQQESLVLEDEIGEGVFGKVFKGLSIFFSFQLNIIVLPLLL